MLSRVANNLYWMGRYIERSDRLARYLRVNYFSSLDAPTDISRSRPFVLNSIEFAFGLPVNDHPSEERVLYEVGLSRDQSLSLFRSIYQARENARGTRDLISADLWEAINRLYHFVHEYPRDLYIETGMYDYTLRINERNSSIHGKIQETLMHDQIHALIMLGIHVERAIQTTRIIITKLLDTERIEQIRGLAYHDQYEWHTLMNCLDVFNMSKQFYKSTPEKNQCLEFLLLNQQCPRSVGRSLSLIHQYMSKLSNQKKMIPYSSEFEVGRLLARFQFLTVTEIEYEIEDFLNTLLRRLNDISMMFEEVYLSY